MWPSSTCRKPRRDVRVLEFLARFCVLDLIEKDVVLLVPVRDLPAQVGRQRGGVAERGVLLDVERDLDGVLVADDAYLALIPD